MSNARRRVPPGFGEWVRATRSHARRLDDDLGFVVEEITGKELALRAGLMPAYISKLELGRENPSDETIERIARGLGADPDEAFVQADRLRPDLAAWILAGGLERVRKVRAYLTLLDTGPEPGEKPLDNDIREVTG